MIYLRFFCVLLRNAFGTRLLLSLKTKFLLFSIARNNRTCASAFYVCYSAQILALSLHFAHDNIPYLELCESYKALYTSYTKN